MSSSTDVFVIGGGPAGLAAAIAARQRGFRVVVADSAEPPIDKACGEGLMPDALGALEKLGIAIAAGDSHPLCGVRFLSSGLTADAPFPEARQGLGVRRTTLHSLMAERARVAGVDLLWRTVVTGIASDAVFLGGQKINVRWIIGADGGSSRVRRWAGLCRCRKGTARYAFRRHYRIAPWTDRMEVYWGHDSQAYMAAVGSEQVCVAVASPDPTLRLDEALRSFPVLRDRLKTGEIATTEKGSVTATCSLKRVCSGNVALIGDASGTVDAITGEGLSLSFNQAIALADCLRAGYLSHYQQEHRRLALRPTLMARLMLTLDGRPELQRRTLQVFRKRPEIFRRFVALHVGSLPPQSLALDGITLGWGLLTA